VLQAVAEDLAEVTCDTVGDAGDEIINFLPEAFRADGCESRGGPA